MAKIVLICRQLTPQILEMADGLHQQKNTIIVLTSFDQKFDGIFDFQILTYFKKWSILEALKIVKHWILAPPDVFHFFFLQENETATAADWVLLAMAESLQKATVTTLLGSKVRSKKWKWNPFLKVNRAITVPTRERLMYLKRHHLIAKNKISEVILPLKERHTLKKNAQSEMEKFILSLNDFFLIPVHPRSDFLEKLNSTIKIHNLQALFIGPRTRTLSKFQRFFSVSDITNEQLTIITKKAKAIILAFHEFDTVELMKWQALAFSAEIPLIVNQQQTEMLPGLCLNGKNGFVLESSWQSLQKLLANNFILKLNGHYHRHELQPNFDLSLNEFSRLYIRALTQT